jgi:hypothetical protein
MGDIKSTLDLVMARTRHLSLSDEERQKQKTKEITLKINGLIQKYLDQGLKIERFQSGWQQIKISNNVSDERLLCTALANKIDLNRDMEILFGLMSALDGLNPAPFKALYKNYQKERAEVAQKLKDSMAIALAEESKISGSAVVPNIEKSVAWTQALKSLHEKYNQYLLEARREFGAV